MNQRRREVSQKVRHEREKRCTRNCNGPRATTGIRSSKFGTSHTAAAVKSTSDSHESIVRIIEWWESGSHEINYSSGGGFLLIGYDPDRHEVVMNLDKDRTGHLNFSPSQARHLAFNLLDKARALDGKPLTARS